MDLMAGGIIPGFAASDVGASAVRRRTWLTRFVPEKLYSYLAQQTFSILDAVSPSNTRVLEIPPSYTSVRPLDITGPNNEGEAGVSVTGTFGYVTSVFKVISVEDAMPYALRRVENVRAPPQLLQAIVTAWRRVVHPSVISLRSANVHNTALFFAHDYIPGAHSLKQEYFDRPGVSPPDEATLWSYICQIVGALSAVHAAGLSFRGLHAAHILIVPGSRRLRLGGAGVFDVLESDSKKSVAEHQASDIAGLGVLLLRLATGNRDATGDPALAMQQLAISSVTTELQSLLLLLLSGGMGLDKIVQVRLLNNVAVCDPEFCRALCH
jgi:hypothetical protein